jgi:hypothetical protein
LGREIGRTEPVREELRRAREAAGDEEAEPHREPRPDDADVTAPPP